MYGLIDLHLHLDGSLSPDTIRRLAAMQNIPISIDDDELASRLTVSKDCRDLNEYLEKFDFPLSLLQTKEAIEESVYCLCRELDAQGLVYAEIRFAPQLHCEKGLSQSEVVRAAIKGLERSGFFARLILCCMRGADNKTENIETVKVAAEYLGQGVCAVDLAGAEGLYPTEDFEDVFALAKEMGIPFTIHAGEADGPQSVRTAIKFGARRIGHGVRSVEDEALVQKIAEAGIALELCPTSNLNTCVCTDIREYPIKQLMEAGVRVTVNTDNMTVSGTTLAHEYEILKKAFGFDDEIIENLIRNAAEAAFEDTEVIKKAVFDKC